MDKNKIFQTATRLAQRGNLDRAIAEYKRLVEADPNEVRALLKIGELYQKKGANEEASRALERAAETYAKQGFFLKAVAVYKQVLKLTPTVEAHQRLADLYQQLGLLREAMAQLQLVVATYEREGNTEKTIVILRKMLDLDPENALGRARLGELLLALGDEKEGREELERALAQLENEGRSDDFLRVASRLFKGDAADPALARKMAKIYLDRGEARRALAKLQVAFKADATSVETLTLLARGFQEIGDKKKTVAVYKELARLHKEAGQAKEEREAWKQVLRLAPDDAQARAALQTGAPKPPATPPPLKKTAEPEAIPVPDARGTRVAEPEAEAMPMPGTSGPREVPSKEPPPPAKPEEASRLLAELDVYLKYKLYPKAKDHLQRLLALDPDSLEVQERAAQLAERTGDRDGLRAALLKVVTLARAAGEAGRAEKGLARLNAEFPGDSEVAALGTAPEMASVSSLIVVDDEPVGEDEVVMAVSLDDDEPLVPPMPESEEVSAFPLIEEDSALQAALELSSLEPGAVEETFHEPLLEIQVGPPEPAVAEAPRAQLEPEPAVPPRPAPTEAVREAAKPVAPPMPEPEPEPAAPSMPEPPAETSASAPPAPEPEPVPIPSAPPAAADPALEADLEEASFYLQQGMEDEAEELLRSILEKAPGHEKALALLETLEGGQPAASPAQPSSPAAQAETTPRPPRPTFAKALTVEPEEEATFDLAEELLADMDLVESEPTQVADFQYSVEEVLEEFKKGVSQTVRPEDSETHYNLGIAYKEMGLFSEAIGAFQQAASGAKGTEREVDCMITAGLCQVELGAYEKAIEFFRAGLGAAALNAASALALHYEIGSAYESLGEKEKALEYFTKVHRSDPGYREVAAALERLQNGGGNPSAPPPMNKGKVGYV